MILIGKRCLGSNIWLVIQDQTNNTEDIMKTVWANDVNVDKTQVE